MTTSRQLASHAGGEAGLSSELISVSDAARRIAKDLKLSPEKATARLDEAVYNGAFGALDHPRDRVPRAELDAWIADAVG